MGEKNSNITKTIESYHCPNCGAPIDFSTSKYSKFTCKYCGSIADIFEQRNLAHKSITPDSLLDYAYKKLNEGDYDSAINNFEEVLRRDITVSSAYWGLFLASNNCRDDECLYNDYALESFLNKIETTSNDANIIKNNLLLLYKELDNAILYATEIEANQYNAVIDKLSNEIVLYYFNKSIDDISIKLTKLESNYTESLFREIEKSLSMLGDIKQIENNAKQNDLSYETRLKEANNRLLEIENDFKNEMKISKIAFILYIAYNAVYTLYILFSKNLSISSFGFVLLTIGLLASNLIAYNNNDNEKLSEVFITWIVLTIVGFLIGVDNSRGYYLMVVTPIIGIVTFVISIVFIPSKSQRYK